MSNPEERFGPVKASSTFRRIRKEFGLSTKKVLDIGCGYGEYLSLFGAGSLGITTTPAEVDFAGKKGLRVIVGNAEFIDLVHAKTEETFDAVWANNLFEHLLSPHAFLIRLKKPAKEDTLLILGVPVVPRFASLMRIGKFRGALAAAHISFFTRETLKLSVERAGWKVSVIRPFVSSYKIIDFILSFFAPHLYIIAHNDAHFQYADKKLKEWKDDPFYQDMLSITGQARN